MWIIAASMHWRWRWFLTDHMLLNEFSALTLIQHGDFSEKKKNTFVSSSTYTTLMNNASDAAENTFILTVCLRITGNRIFLRKKSENLMDCWIWLNEPTSMLCNTDIWNNANDKTALTMISLRDEMSAHKSIASAGVSPNSVYRLLSLCSFCGFLGFFLTILVTKSS